ncbi:8479_t:CDS:2 [Rhizophagus irregularis]|nr:8479_t:CDS:2 [Rhizophagus irregularis]
MPPLQQTQKEKHQGRRTNPYRRPRLPYELIGSQFEWAQAQQLLSNTVENEWQNMTSNEFGDNTNDYDDNEKPSIKQVSEPKVLMVAN